MIHRAVEGESFTQALLEKKLKSQRKEVAMFKSRIIKTKDRKPYLWRPGIDS